MDVKKMNIFERVMYGKQHNEHSPLDKATAINADKDIKICKFCNRVFEVFTAYARIFACEFYHDFPRYGKGKCECPYCRIKRNKLTFYYWDRGTRKEFDMKYFQTVYRSK